MYRVADTLAGRPITLVHSAAQLSVEVGLGPMKYRRSVVRHLKESKASHALCVLDDKIATWRASFYGGYSFAAALEAWFIEQKPAAQADTSRQNHRCLMIVPLDRRVYLAEISRGLVDSESCAFLDKALAVMEKKVRQGMSALLLKTDAHTQKHLTGYATPLDYEINLRKYRYAPVWLTFLRNKLPHPLHAVPLLALLLPVIFLHEEPKREIATLTQVVKPKPQTVLFNAAARLRMLVDFLTREQIGHIAGSVKELTLDSGGLVVRGSAATGYPSNVAQFARVQGAAFVLESEGWKFFKPLGAGGERKTVEAFSYNSLLQRVMAAAATVGTLKIAGIFETQQVTSATIEIKMNGPTAAHFASLAATLDDQPVTLTKLVCKLELGFTRNCHLILSIAGTNR